MDFQAYVTEKVKELTGLLSSLNDATYIKVKKDFMSLGDFLQELQAKGGVIIFKGEEWDMIDFDKKAIYLLGNDGKILRVSRGELRRNKIWVVYKRGVFICCVGKNETTNSD